MRLQRSMVERDSFSEFSHHSTESSCKSILNNFLKTSKSIVIPAFQREENLLIWLSELVIPD